MITIAHHEPMATGAKKKTAEPRSVFLKTLDPDQLASDEAIRSGFTKVFSQIENT